MKVFNLNNDRNYVSVGDDSDQAAAVTLIEEYQRQLSSKTMNRQGMCLSFLFCVFTVDMFVTGIWSLSTLLLQVDETLL